jgi:hypothetical protein
VKRVAYEQLVTVLRMAEEVTLEQLRVMAAQAGLSLSDEELQHLLPGVNRAFKQVRDLRGLLSDSDEPAAGFTAAAGNRKDPK